MATAWSPMYLIRQQQLSCLLLLTCLLLSRLISARPQADTTADAEKTLHYGIWNRYPYRNTSFLPPYTNTSRPITTPTRIPTFTEPPSRPNATIYTTYTTEIVTVAYCPCVPDPHDPGKTTEMCPSSRTLTVTLTATMTSCTRSGQDKCPHTNSHGHPLPTHDVGSDSSPTDSYNDDDEEDEGNYGGGDEEEEHKVVPEGEDEECDNGGTDVPEEEIGDKEYENSDGDEHQDVPEEEGGEEECDIGDEEGEYPEEEDEGDGGEDGENAHGCGKQDSGGNCILPPSPTPKTISSDLVDYDNEKCGGGCKTKTPISHEHPTPSPKLPTPTSKEDSAILVVTPSTTIGYTVTASITHFSFSKDKPSTVDSPDSNPSKTDITNNSSTTSTPTYSWTGPDFPTYIAGASRFVYAPGKVAGQLGILMACIWAGLFVVGNHI